MTAIVYHQDALVGDSSHYSNYGGNYSTVFKPKIRLHPSKLFAFGICGNYLPLHNDEFEAAIEQYALKVIKGEEVTEPFPYPDVHVLVMSKQFIFGLGWDVKNKTGVSMLDNNAALGVGSGADYAIYAIESGLTIEEAMKEAVKMDAMTGGNIYGVKREILVDYIPEEGESDA